MDESKKGTAGAGTAVTFRRYRDGCNRNEVEDFVGINSVEHFIGD